MANITRGSITLPAEVSNEIIQSTQEGSAVMQLARQVTLPGRGSTIQVITGDPAAEWVAEGAAKPVSNATLSTKLMTPYKLAVIEIFSMEFTRDAAALYDALIDRIPLALAQKFDATVAGNIQKPGNNFDNFANCTKTSIEETQNATTYDGLVSADTDVATHGGIVDGYVIAPQGKGLLLASKDTTGRPIFINSVAEGAIPMILGARTLQSKGVYKAGTAGSPGTPAIVGICGDWTKAVYGTVSGVEITVSDQASIASNGSTYHLWQENLVAVRAEIELGFRADTSVFNLLTGETPSA